MEQNDSPPQKMRSGEVDALRACAMLGVITIHAHLMPFGWAGVWLFYVISGYVVTHSVINRPDEPVGMTGFIAFMRRRAVRILPVYFAYILIGLTVSAFLGSAQDALSVASLALFWNNIAMILGSGRIEGWPTGHLWTLSVEMQFYIVYGLALYLAPRRFIVPMLVALLLLCPLARLGASDMLAAQGWSALDAAYAIYAGPVLHFDIFAMGALLAFAQKAGLLDRMARPLALIGFTALILYFTFYVGVNHYVRNAHGSDLIRNIISGILIGEYREVTLYSALGLAMTGLVALAAKGDIWVRSVLQLRSLQYIGSISYGGYIFHQLGLKWATILLGTMGIITRQGGIAAHVAQLAIGLAITLMLAWLSFRWIETPARHLFSTTPAKNRLPTARYGSLEAS